jgi:hypothetical protein
MFFFPYLIEIHLLLQLFSELLLQAEVGTDNGITKRPPTQTINCQHNGLPTTRDQQQLPRAIADHLYSERYNYNRHSEKQQQTAATGRYNRRSTNNNRQLNPKLTRGENVRIEQTRSEAKKTFSCDPQFSFVQK